VPEPDPVFLGGLFPGINFLLTTWYNRNEQNLVISLFYAGSTLAGGYSLFLSSNLLRCLLYEKVPLEDFWRSVSDTWPMSAGRTVGPGCARLFPWITCFLSPHVARSLLACIRFILEGLLTFLCAIPAWWLVPDFPDDHRVLKGIDRERWLHRLAKNQGVTNAPLPFSWRQVRRAFTDWRTYVYAVT
jgi:MFS transporter, ACS family, DAL5 transporter family protein